MQASLPSVMRQAFNHSIISRPYPYGRVLARARTGAKARKGSRKGRKDSRIQIRVNPLNPCHLCSPFILSFYHSISRKGAPIRTSKSFAKTAKNLPVPQSLSLSVSFSHNLTTHSPIRPLAHSPTRPFTHPSFVRMQASLPSVMRQAFNHSIIHSSLPSVMRQAFNHFLAKVSQRGAKVSTRNFISLRHV